ncbi:MAG TPA: TRAM domain-containing protein, partial [Nocardioidaceae bacterium]|nr:TRAM domain-containing protein [Nocardioidaceae bacterium]
MSKRNREPTARGRSLVGERYVVTTGRVGHGGFVVARHRDVVVFVRHALPAERVEVVVTEGDEGSRFLRADAVRVLEASADRVEAPCPYAGPGLCGGCDFQHVALPAQRALKAEVVREQLVRLAGIPVVASVEPVSSVEPVETHVPVEPVETTGLGWRTRVQFAVDDEGRAGLRKHRSHDVIPVDRCLIAHPDLPDPVVEVRGASRASKPPVDSAIIETVVSGTGERLRLVTGRDGTTYADGPEMLHERALGRVWQVRGSSFWQVHPGAAETLAHAVLAMLEPRAGEHALDLYAGVGLFSGALAQSVGPGGRVTAVEADGLAAADAAANLADLPHVDVVADRVDRALRRGLLGSSVDLVVLDPPRTGAKRRVVERIAALAPRAMAYVACDPAALARDVAIFAERGYQLSALRAFDLFPMTHHVE